MTFYDRVSTDSEKEEVSEGEEKDVEEEKKKEETVFRIKKVLKSP